jgi:hypothetical protein
MTPSSKRKQPNFWKNGNGIEQIDPERSIQFMILLQLKTII